MGFSSVVFMFLVCIRGARIITILRDSNKMTTSLTSADPYAWELQKNPVSGNSCYSLDERTLPALTTVKDTGCVGYDKPASKCHGGFPFYRFSAGPPGCVDCMDAGRCQMLCLSKGMDAAALVLSEESIPVECRCGATRKNLSVWSLLEVGQMNFGPVHSLLPPTQMSAVPVTDPRCAMFVYMYKDARERNGGVPSQFVSADMTDDFYVRQVVSGLTDPGDVEDSTVLEGERAHLAVKNRLALWLKANPTNRVPRDEIFVEQVAEHQKTVSAPGCVAIDEPFTCWDSAVDSVLAANSLTQTDSTGAFTSGYMTLMMTVPYATWQSLFGSGAAVSTTSQSLTRSGFCASAANVQQCPITCGTCQLYDRGPATASMYTTWAASNTDASSGIVTIPVVFDTNPAIQQYLGPSVQQMVANATQVWAAVSCVNFQLYASPPTSGHYVIISIDLDSTGTPASCLADPVGMPEATFTRISVGGCHENKNPLGSLIHEFAHVLGLVHTQMRPDRDAFITMNPLMVLSGYEPNFFLAPYAFDGAQGTYSSYDYGSIMHYTRTQAANPAKYVATSPTMSGTFQLVQTLAAGVTLGQRNALSVLDIAEVNSLYSCNSVLANVAHTSTAVDPTTAAMPEVTIAATTASPTSPTNTISPTGINSTANPVGGGGTISSTGNNSTTNPVGGTIIPTNTTTAWSGWEDDMQTIGNAVDAVINSEDINLSMDQLNLLQDILNKEQALYTLFSNLVNTQAITPGWRDTVVGIANDMLGIVADSKAGVAQYTLSTNPSQEAILDEPAIASLMTALQSTQVVYSKLVAYLHTVPGGLSAHDLADLAHPSTSETVVAWSA